MLGDPGGVSVKRKQIHEKDIASCHGYRHCPIVSHGEYDK